MNRHHSQEPAEGSRDIVERELMRRYSVPIERSPTLHDIERALADVTDSSLAAIAALDPQISDLEEAIVWQRGDADMIGRFGHPLTGKAAQIYDILTADDDPEEDYRSHN